MLVKPCPFRNERRRLELWYRWIHSTDSDICDRKLSKAWYYILRSCSLKLTFKDFNIVRSLFLLVPMQRNDMFQVFNIYFHQASFIREGRKLAHPWKVSEITRVIFVKILYPVFFLFFCFFPGLRNGNETHRDPSGVFHDTIASGKLNLSVTSSKFIFSSLTVIHFF